MHDPPGRDARLAAWDRGQVPGPERTPEQATVAVRGAVRRALAGLPDAVRNAPLLVACSGGADSTALLAAVRAIAPGRVHVAVVDHRLQDGSGERAAALVAGLVDEGVPATVHRVDVSGPGGTEAAARRARYAVLRAARPHADSAVLLGHTLDDQAETVLLGLGRGSGPRSVAGMVEDRPPYWRPLLAVRRGTTRRACADQGMPVWDDPWNDDPAYTRVRLRTEVLPLLEEVLGGGVAPALARTAALLREDLDALDDLAAGQLARLAAEGGGADGGLPAPELAQLPAALRRRVLRGWLRASGVPDLQAVHLGAVDALLTRWRGQGRVDLPGGAGVVRASGRLAFLPPEDRGGRPAPTDDLEEPTRV
jgi:tRNA(Ile)-lysidine synthase